MKDSYTKDAVTNLRLKISKIEKGVKKAFFMPAWNKLMKKSRLERRKSHLVESTNAYEYYKSILKGEYLDKFHLSSNGHKKQFFQIVDTKELRQLRWCDKEKDITKISACHSYQLNQIKGIVYGKITPTFRKKSNDKLEPWLCFSLMMDKRSFDVYCTEDNINKWYIGLAYAIKKHNDKAYCLSLGKFLWRKLKMVLIYLVTEKMTPEQKKNQKKEMSFIQALRRFQKLKINY